MRSQSSLDFAVRSTPEQWSDDIPDTAIHDTSPMTAQKQGHLRRFVKPVDVLSGTVVGILAAAGMGGGWYYMLTRTGLDSPYLPVIIGIVIALVVRVAGGPGEPDVRSTISVFLLAATIIAVTYFVERYNIHQITDDVPTLEAIERRVKTHHLQDPKIIGGWLGGLLVCVQLSYLTRKRR